MTVWTRDAEPRKWAALLHNIACAEGTFGMIGKGDHKRLVRLVERWLL